MFKFGQSFNCLAFSVWALRLKVFSEVGKVPLPTANQNKLQRYAARGYNMPELILRQSVYCAGAKTFPDLGPGPNYKLTHFVLRLFWMSPRSSRQDRGTSPVFQRKLLTRMSHIVCRTAPAIPVCQK